MCMLYLAQNEDMTAAAPEFAAGHSLPEFTALQQGKSQNKMHTGKAVPELRRLKFSLKLQKLSCLTDKGSAQLSVHFRVTAPRPPPQSKQQQQTAASRPAAEAPPPSQPCVLCVRACVRATAGDYRDPSATDEARGSRGAAPSASLVMQPASCAGSACRWQ